MAALPFADNSFNKGFAVNSTQVWPDAVAGLFEIRRVLRRGGRIALGFTPPSGQQKEGLAAALAEAGFAFAKLAREFLADFDPPLPFVNADDIARELSPEDVSKAAAEVGRIAIRRMNSLLEAGASFALETTLSGHFQIGLAERARRQGWSVLLTFIFLRSPALNIRRVALRVRAGGHHVADQDVVRRHSRSLENLWNLIHLCDQWSILENSGARARLIAAGSTTGTVIHDDATYRWLESFDAAR